MAASSPSGTVTFLFTDIEGSTRRWEQEREAMGAVLQRHDTILRQAIEDNRGYVFKTVGDAFYAAFSAAPQALEAALAAQRALFGEQGDDEAGPIRVRMALHTGATEERDGDYFGPTLNRVARLLSAGHGGQVLLSAATWELVRDHLPADVSLKDMGEHRLKDITRTEYIFQLVAAGLPRDFPPLRTLNSRPNNLPIQPTPLVGREKEVEALSSLLRRSDVRLLTLTGPGGIGKTRLGLQLAAELIDDFEHGTFFVSLTFINDPGLVVPTVAQALGVQEIGGMPPLDTLKDYLRDRQLLLILDNFEQVIEAAPLVSELLATTPRLKISATSRTALHLRGEKEFPVPPLDLPDPKHLPPFEELTRYEAVRLFVERAIDAKPDFQLTIENAPAVAEICHRLDGLPLAIELAAARIKLLPPQAMLARLQGYQSRLKLLTGGARDMPARQQTLRNTIEWSYDLLNEGERQLFRRMSAFVGGCTLEAAEAVCNPEGELPVDLLDGLGSLLDKSLLRQEEDESGEPRFSMLQTIREYADEKLKESGGGEGSREAESIRRQHALFYLALAEQGDQELRGPNQQAWFKRLEREHDNLRASLRWSLENEETEVGLRLAGALAWFWHTRSHFVEGRNWLEELLAQPRAAAHAKARAKALYGIGILAWLQSDWVTMRASMEESRAISQELGDKHRLAYAIGGLGMNAQLQGNWEEAHSRINEAMALFQEVGDKWGLAWHSTGFSLEAMREGELNTARTRFEETLRLFREVGDRWASAIQVDYLAQVLEKQGDYASALLLHEQALGIYREAGDRVRTADTLNRIGIVLQHQGDYERAIALHIEGLAMSQELGRKRGIPWRLEWLAWAFAALCQVERAAKLLGGAAALRKALSAPLPASLRDEYDRQVAGIRAQLGEEAWQNAWEEGRAMTSEQAIAYALEGTTNA